jgi:hypothetical protein
MAILMPQALHLMRNVVTLSRDLLLRTADLEVEVIMLEELDLRTNNKILLRITLRMILSMKNFIRCLVGEI